MFYLIHNSFLISKHAFHLEPCNDAIVLAKTAQRYSYFAGVLGKIEKKLKMIVLFLDELHYFLIQDLASIPSLMESYQRYFD